MWELADFRQNLHSEAADPISQDQLGSIPCKFSDLAVSSTYIDEDLVVAYFHGIAVYSDGRVLPYFAGPHIILPAMPRARYYRALQRTISQRPSSVKTNVIDGMELPIYVRHRNRLPLHLKLSNRPRRHIRDLGSPHKPHSSLLALFYVISVPSVVKSL